MFNFVPSLEETGCVVMEKTFKTRQSIFASLLLYQPLIKVLNSF